MLPAEKKALDQMQAQHGLISRDEALRLGMSASTIDSRRRSGRWETVTRGVYRLAGVPSDWHQLAHAACLARDGDAVASMLTAAALAGFARPPSRPHLTVPRGAGVSSPVATVHRARLHPIDRTSYDGIPATTPARTLVDLARPSTASALERLVDDAMHTHRTLTARSVEAAWDRAQFAPGRHGWSKLDTALEDWRSTIKPGSPAEKRAIRMVQQWGFPEPERQIQIRDSAGNLLALVDLGWRLVRIGVEYDSERWHDRDRWSADERRHQRVEAAGWHLLHLDKGGLRPGDSSFRRDLERAWRAASTSVLPGA